MYISLAFKEINRSIDLVQELNCSEIYPELFEDLESFYFLLIIEPCLRYMK